MNAGSGPIPIHIGRPPIPGMTIVAWRARPYKVMVMNLRSEELVTHDGITTVVVGAHGYVFLDENEFAQGTAPLEGIFLCFTDGQIAHDSDAA